MRQFRGASPVREYWEAEDLANHLNCSVDNARNILDGYHKEKQTHRYGAVEKTLILAYVEEKLHEKREQHVRFLADVASVERTEVLKQQVKTLEEMSRSSNRRAVIANRTAWVSIVIASLALIVAILDLLSNAP